MFASGLSQTYQQDVSGNVVILSSCHKFVTHNVLCMPRKCLHEVYVCDVYRRAESDENHFRTNLVEEVKIIFTWI
jgi:hypothetical protein